MYTNVRIRQKDQNDAFLLLRLGFYGRKCVGEQVPFAASLNFRNMYDMTHLYASGDSAKQRHAHTHRRSFLCKYAHIKAYTYTRMNTQVPHYFVINIIISTFSLFPLSLLLFFKQSFCIYRNIHTIYQFGSIMINIKTRKQIKI